MDYLKRGLLALSRAHLANSMSGHYGAPLVATELLLADHPELPDQVAAGLHGELDRLMVGEESWFNPDQAKITVAGLFDDTELTGASVPLDPLTEALSGSIDALRQSGHNVIFAALALRGLQHRPELATAALVDGIRQFLELFRNAGPGRLYLSNEEWVDPRKQPLDEDPEPYADEIDLVHGTLDALAEHIAERHRTLGDLHHIINHAAALVDLRRMGYTDLAARGLPIQREHLRHWLESPDLRPEVEERTTSAADAITPEYWANADLERGSALLSHRPKTIYGFEILAAAATDPELVKAGRKALRYLF